MKRKPKKKLQASQQRRAYDGLIQPIASNAVIQARLKPVPAWFYISASGETDLDLQAAEGKDEKKLRKFSMTAYTGGRLFLANFDYPVVVDLSGLRIPAKARPIFRDHDSGKIVGHANDFKNSGGSLKVAGVISGANEHSREVIESSDNEFPWESSIGAASKRMVFVDRGETVQVNGRKFTGPVYVARQSVLGEVSFVALGADEGGASAKVAATATGPSVGVETMDFEQWLEAKGFKLADLNEKQIASMQAQYDAEQVELEEDPEPKPKKRGKKDKPVKASRRRTDDDDDEEEEDEDDPLIEARRQLRAEYASDLKRMTGIGKLCKDHPEIHAKAIEEGWDLTKTELEVLRASRPSPQKPGGGVGNSGDKKAAAEDAQVIEASMLISAGVSEEFVGEECGFSEKVMNEALSAEFRGFGITALAEATIHASGGHFRGARKTNAFIRASLEADRTLRASGFSTLSLSNILENVAGKIMLASYQAQEVVWPYICAVRSHSDFKAHSTYRLDATGAFKKVGADGELKHVGLTDSKYSSQLDTYGCMIVLSRVMQYNDDLNAFAQIPRLIGQMGAIRCEEGTFVQLLSNAGNFFHTNNKNVISGGGSVLGIAGMSLAKNKFRNRVNTSGKPILVSGKILLTGTTLADTADSLWSQEKMAVTTTTDTPRFENNPHKGLFKPYNSPYLNNTDIRDQDGAALSNQSDTLWFLLSDPNVLAALIIAFLNGQKTPTIESAETDFSTLGMQWRAFQDIAFAYEDPNGATRSAGA